MHYKLLNNRESNNASIAVLLQNRTICMFPLHVRKIEIVHTHASFQTGIRHVHHGVIVSSQLVFNTELTINSVHVLIFH